MSRIMEAVNQSDSESASSDEESFAGSDAEPQPNQIQAAKPLDQRLPSSSDEEGDSGSESDSDAPVSNVRPLACKSSVQSPVVPLPVAVTPAKSAAPKRAADETVESKDAKKPRAAEAVTETSEKKMLPFERLWTEEDEIVVLQGMIDYSSQKKSDPMSDLNAFHEFIKDDLHTDFGKAKLHDKIRSLKRKFDVSKKRVNEGKSFKPHAQKVYDLSKRIWVNETVNGSAVKKTASKKVNVPESAEVKEAKKAVEPMRLSSSMEEKMLIAGRELDGRDDWEKLKLEEMELFYEQLELRVLQTKLILDAMKAKMASR